MKFEDVKPILSYLNRFGWKSDIEDEKVFELAKKQFKNIANHKTRTKNFLRIIGQSGSGKTTQLLPVGNVFFQIKNLNQIHFCVRNFAFLHPYYEKLLKKFGKIEIREATNGFALKMLVVSLIFAIEKGYDILLEMTLLTPKFERILTDFLIKNEYDIKLFGLAVSSRLSNYFIEQRKISKGVEQGRKVYSTSVNFFNKNLCKSIRFLSVNYSNLEIVLWDHYELLPIYFGKIGGCLSAFFKSRLFYSKNVLKEQELKLSKCEFIKSTLLAI